MQPESGHGASVCRVLAGLVTVALVGVLVLAGHFLSEWDFLPSLAESVLCAGALRFVLRRSEMARTFAALPRFKFQVLLGTLILLLLAHVDFGRSGWLSNLPRGTDLFTPTAWWQPAEDDERDAPRATVAARPTRPNQF